MTPDLILSEFLRGMTAAQMGQPFNRACNWAWQEGHRSFVMLHSSLNLNMRSAISETLSSSSTSYQKRIRLEAISGRATTNCERLAKQFADCISVGSGAR